MEIPTQTLEEIALLYHQPREVSIPWHLKPWRWEDERYKYEMEVMARLCYIQNPKRAFEFGTFRGFTALVMACNTSPDSEIFTLDVPQDWHPPSSYDENNASFVDRRYGTLHFKDQPEGKKIKRLYGDSKEFDVSPYRRAMDLIFVDGCHMREYIMNDTRKSFEMASEGGIILWHDYKTTWPDVTPFLEELTERVPLVHLKGTNYVLFQNC